MNDPGTAGPAKAVLAALRARGVDLEDFDAVKAALEDLGPMKLPPAAPKRRPGAAAAPAEVVAAAERSPVLARFAALVDFYGDGRKLTQTGQPTLADARALVERLGTGDRMDPRIGDRTFTTKSAADLPELGFTIRWGVTAAALRKEHGKLRATASWRKLEGKPLQRWLKAADALATLGPLAGYHAYNRYRGREEVLDELLPMILQLLVGGPMSFDEVLDRVFEQADAMYEWLTPYMQDPQHRRTSLGWDLERLTRILGWAGIADRVGAATEPDEWEPQLERLVGGRLQLTQVGQWWLEPPDGP
jgi:hypothetical protein